MKILFCESLQILLLIKINICFAGKKRIVYLQFVKFCELYQKTSHFFCSVALLEHKITVYLRSFFLKSGKKFIELLRMTARIICNEQIFIRSKTIMRQLYSQFLLLILLKLYNEEFDPGSG